MWPTCPQLKQPPWVHGLFPLCRPIGFADSSGLEHRAPTERDLAVSDSSSWLFCVPYLEPVLGPLPGWNSRGLLAEAIPEARNHTIHQWTVRGSCRLGLKLPGLYLQLHPKIAFVLQNLSSPRLPPAWGSWIQPSQLIGSEMASSSDRVPRAFCLASASRTRQRPLESDLAYSWTRPMPSLSDKSAASSWPAHRPIDWRLLSRQNVSSSLASSDNCSRETDLVVSYQIRTLPVVNREHWPLPLQPLQSAVCLDCSSPSQFFRRSFVRSSRPRNPAQIVVAATIQNSAHPGAPL